MTPELATESVYEGIEDVTSASVHLFHLEDLRKFVERVMEGWEQEVTFIWGKVEVTINYQTQRAHFKVRRPWACPNALVVRSDDGIVVIGSSSSRPSSSRAVLNHATSVIEDDADFPQGNDHMWVIHDVPTILVADLVKLAEDVGIVPKGWMKPDAKDELTTVAWMMFDDEDEPVF